MSEQTVNYKRLMSEKFLTNPIWEEFAQAISELFEIEIHQPRRLLATIRDVHSLEQVIKGFTLRNMSVDVTADYLATVDLDKALDATPEFYRQRSAVDKFIHYIGYLTGVRLNVVGLYTEDYIHFYDQPLGLLLDQGGQWYATTHVYVEFLGDGSLANDEIIEKLFLAYAPIQFVLYYILEKFDLGAAVVTIAGGWAEGLEKTLFTPNLPTASLYMAGADISYTNDRFAAVWPVASLYVVGFNIDFERIVFRPN